LPPLFEGQLDQPSEAQIPEQTEVYIDSKYVVKLDPVDPVEGEYAFFRLHDELVKFNKEKKSGEDLTFELIQDKNVLPF